MPKRPFRILLVEDDALQARLAQVALEGHGFKSLTLVDTAAEALRLAPEHELVLLDVQLPDGSGLDVLRKLRERSTRPAVVIVTGFGAETIAAEALRLGADDYVTKSPGFADLLAGVVERIRRSIALRNTLESTEREMVEAERRSAVGEMTVALHHELNNPLMVALSEVTLLQEEPGLSDSAQQALGIIRAALNRIRSVVKQAGTADGARSTDYLAGTLKMTDLEVTDVMRGLRGRALVVAEELALRRIVSVLLRREGFDPEPFDGIADAVPRLKEAPVPSVVVVAGIPSGDADPFGTGDRAWSRPWTLVVIAAPGAGGLLGEHADLSLPLPFDPATFAGQVLAAVEHRRTSGLSDRRVIGPPDRRVPGHDDRRSGPLES